MVLRCPYILKQAGRLPKGPGVYVFLDRNNKPLYIGRATSLRRRVLSYFRPSTHSINTQGGERSRTTGSGFNPRIEEMVNSAKKIKHYKTDNLLEAIILEANLIKKYWPKYNVKEKDNRSFIYIVIPKKDFSRPFIVRGKELNKFPQKQVFGPYQSLSLIKNGLRIIRKIFPYSTCRINSGKACLPAGRPCFDYQIGLCPGACIGAISKENYQKNIENLILFLRGEKKKLLEKLKKENPVAIQSLKHIQDVSLIKDDNFQFSISNFQKINKIEGYDVSHLTGKETYGSMVVFTNETADKTQYRLFKIREAPANDDLRALQEMIERRLKHSEWPLPNLILIDGGKPQISFISKTLKRLNIAIPIVGISKYAGPPAWTSPRRSRAGDKLVFPPKIKSSLKNLIQASKNTLLKVREEAHRFALKSSRRRRRLDK